MQVEAARISRTAQQPAGRRHGPGIMAQADDRLLGGGLDGISIEASQVKTAAVKQLCAGTGVRRLDWRIWSGCETALPD